MPNFALPRAAARAEIPRDIRLQIVSPCAEPPEGDGWLHEIKHDGHRLLAVVAGDKLKLVSRNGYDRTALFREPFQPMAAGGFPAMVLDGEIAVPDERGVTHIDALSEAISSRQAERFAYFAFDLLHLDGHDLRRCAIEDRKALLRDVIGAAGCPRIVHVDYVVGIGRELFQAVRQIGAEGIVSKRVGSIYRGGESRGWLKTKVYETGQFVITAFGEMDGGRVEALYIAEARAGKLIPAGTVKFGLAGKGLRHRLDALHFGLSSRSSFVPVRPELVAEVKFFVLRITVDWDTSQADDFRTRGVQWTVKRTVLERGRAERSDRKSLAQRRSAAVAGCLGSAKPPLCFGYCAAKTWRRCRAAWA